MAKQKFTYVDGDVEVFVEDQKHGKKIQPKKLPVGQISQMPGNPDGFTPQRLLLNLVFELEEKPGDWLEDFDPPIEMHVRYQADDEKSAKQLGKKLALAFWNGVEWIEFTKAKHDLKITSDAQGGVAVVKIKNWGDPPVSWGRI